MEIHLNSLVFLNLILGLGRRERRKEEEKGRERGNRHGCEIDEEEGRRGEDEKRLRKEGGTRKRNKGEWMREIKRR